MQQGDWENLSSVGNLATVLTIGEDTTIQGPRFIRFLTPKEDTPSAVSSVVYLSGTSQNISRHVPIRLVNTCFRWERLNFIVQGIHVNWPVG
jgi:hypothetical protein